MITEQFFEEMRLENQIKSKGDPNLTDFLLTVNDSSLMHFHIISLSKPIGICFSVLSSSLPLSLASPMFLRCSLTPFYFSHLYLPSCPFPHLHHVAQMCCGKSLNLCKSLQAYYMVIITTSFVSFLEKKTY